MKLSVGIPIQLVINSRFTTYNIGSVIEWTNKIHKSVPFHQEHPSYNKGNTKLIGTSKKVNMHPDRNRLHSLIYIKLSTSNVIKSLVLKIGPLHYIHIINNENCNNARKLIKCIESTIMRLSLIITRYWQTPIYASSKWPQNSLVSAVRYYINQSQRKINTFSSNIVNIWLKFH